MAPALAREKFEDEYSLTQHRTLRGRFWDDLKQIKSELTAAGSSLGHKSVPVTQKHYAPPWVKSR
jgi:hypothetical protein